MMEDLIAPADGVERGRDADTILFQLQNGVLGFALQTSAQKLPGKILEEKAVEYPRHAYRNQRHAA